MPPEPAAVERFPPPEWEPVVTRPDPMTEEEREAWLAAEDDEPFDPEEWWDPDGPPPPGEDQLTAEELAGIRAAAADELLALKAASTGRRGPGLPGSARLFPGESASPAAAFGVGPRRAARRDRPGRDGGRPGQGPPAARGRRAGCAGAAVARGLRDGPKCRHDHRLKQHTKWKVDQRPDGTFGWTTPSGRQYTAEPTRYPI